MAMAFFDMDGTLIDGDTNDLMVGILLQRGLIDADFIAPLAEYHRQFALGQLDITAFVRYIVRPLCGLDAALTAEILTSIARDGVLPHVKPGARRALDWHRRRGDVAVIVSSTVDYVVSGLAALLGVAHVIAAPVRQKAGVITGELCGEIPYQDGKVRRIAAFLAEHGWDLADSYAYGDTVNDLPMLRMCAHGVAVDASAPLRRHPDFKSLQSVSWQA